MEAFDCKAADSYAKEYAEAHGIAWENADSWDRQQVVYTLKDLQNLEATGNTGPLAALEPMTPDEGDDEATLAFIKEYNAGIVETNAVAEEYNQSLAMMDDAMSGFDDVMGDVSFSEGRSGTSFAMGELRMVADAGLDVNNDFEISDVDLADDGSLRIATVANGTFFLSVDGSSVYLSRSPIASNNGVAEANFSWGDVMEKCQQFFSYASNWISSVSLQVDLAIANAEKAFNRVSLPAYCRTASRTY